MTEPIKDINDLKKVNDIKENLDVLATNNRDKSLKMLNDIIKLLPKEYSELINQAFIFKRIPKEYLLSSILFTISTAIGLTFYIKTLGYKNFANLYFTIVGSRRDTKSEGLKLATTPLKDFDDQDYDEYRLKMKNYNPETDDEPVRKQTLIQNASIEAVHKIHSENPNSIGIYQDEIYSLVEKMGNSNSRDGSEWRTFLLEGYTNGFVDVSRKTTPSFRIKDTYPTLLGGIQNEFIPKLFAHGNLESGFVDRLLFVPKLTSNKKLNRGQISSKVIEDYSNSVFKILAYKRQSEKPEEEKKQFEIILSEAAKEKIFVYTQELINKQELAKPMIKEYMSKMQISIHKFCLLIHMMKISSDMDFTKLLDENTVDLAIMLNEFYFNNFKIILDENLKTVYKEPTLQEITLVAKKNNASQKAVAEVTGRSKGEVSKWWNKEKNNQKLETSKELKNAG